jgi:aspartyl-tRNA(Asn)/glutamyl-tRNA(Gln) amidotransferase subunit C
MAMAVSHDEVLHLAKLSKLNVSDAEISHFALQLTPIVDYFHELDEVDTTHILETSQTTGLADVLRTDEVNTTSVLTQESALSQAPKSHNGYFVVPAILERAS